MSDDLRLLCADSGVFLRGEALQLGYDDKSLARSRRAGVLHRVRHGAYTFGDDWNALDDLGQHLLTARAVVRTSRSPVVLSHTSAAVLLAAPIWDIPLGDVHVTRRDRKAGRHEAGVAQHRGLLLDDEISEFAGLGCTTPTRTALDITTITDVEHSLVVVDGLLHAGTTDLRSTREWYESRSGWPHTLTTDLVLRLADGRSESAGESRTRYLCWRMGLPAPTPQYSVRDERGNLLGRVDFAWPEYGVFLEFDGRVKYLKYRRPGETVEQAVLREKRREEAICEATGWRCIRISWADLFDRERTAARITRVLRGHALAS